MSHTPRPNMHTWTFPQFLVGNRDFATYLKYNWKEFEKTNIQHKNDLALYWGTAKACIRGKIMSYVAAYKKSIIKSYNQTSQQLRDA